MNLYIRSIHDKIGNIWTHSGFQKYFKNTGWLFVGKFFTFFLVFLVGIWIARYLGPEKYGFLNYVLSFVGLFAFLANLGLDGVLNRELIKNPDNRDKLLGTGFILRFFGAIIAVATVVITSFLVNKESLVNLLIVLFSFTFFLQSFSVIDIYFQSQVIVKNTVKVQILVTFVSGLFKIAFILLHLSIFWFLLSYIIDIFVLAIGLIYIFERNKYSIFQWKFDGNLAKDILKDSWPLVLASASTVIYSRIDQVMIRNYLNDEALGIYSVAVKLSEMWYFVPGLICASLFPAIVKAKHISQDLYFSRLKKLYILMFSLAISFALFLSIFANFIIKLLFGADYLGAVGILQIYVWAGIAVAVGIAVGNYLITENHVKIYFFITLFGAIINVLLNIILIPRSGMVGAAWATLFSYFFVLLSLLFFKKSRKDFSSVINSR